jgi:hypothetical protein
VICFSLWLATPGYGQGIESNWVKIVEAATPAIAVIETDKGLGSGFFVKSDGTLITNSHVIADAKEITVKLKNGETYRRVFIVSVDEQRDLAVLRVEAADVPILPFGNYPGARKRQQSHSNDGTGKSWEQRWPSSRSPGPSHRGYNFFPSRRTEPQLCHPCQLCERHVGRALTVSRHCDRAAAYCPKSPARFRFV